MGVRDEMSKMFKALTGGGEEEVVVTDAPVTDSAVTDTVVTDVPTTEIPDDVVTDAPATDAPTTDLPSKDTDLMAEIERLRNEISEIKSGKPTTKAPSTDAPISDEDWTDGLDLDDLSRDPQELNRVLNLVYKKGIEAAKKAAKDISTSSLSTLPNMVRDNISVVQTLEKVRNEFYEKNEELVPYKDVVAKVFGEIAQKNPDKSYVENLELVGDEVRKRLSIKKGDVINKGKPPKLPSPKGQKRPSQKSESTGFDAELDAMEKALNS